MASAASIAALIAGKATRDALYLSTHDIQSLPRIAAVAAVASIASALTVARLMPRWTPARVAPALLVVSALLSIGEWLLARTSPALAATLIYLHAGVLGPTSASAFWSLVSERFDPHTAKRVVHRIGRGGAVGGVLGGLFAWRAPTFMETRAMLLVLAGLSLVAAFATARVASIGLASPSPARDETGEDLATVGRGLRLLATTPYLRDLGLLVALSAFGAGILDYLVGAGAAHAHGSASDLLTFFALLHLATSVGTLAVQSLLVRPVLARLGLSWSIAISRAAPLLSAAAYLALPGALALVVLRAPEATLQSSLYRSGYELLYTPVAEQAKRSTKTLIDVGLDRLGVALAGGTVIVVTTVFMGPASHVLLGLATATFAASLLVTRRLSTGYVRALESRLKAGSISVDTSDVVDALTLRTLSGSTTHVDRSTLLAQIEAHRALTTRPPPDVERSAESVDPLLADVAALRSGDSARARSVLVERRPIAAALVGHAIPLLADPALGADARTALKTASSSAAGQLADALLDLDQPVAVRRGVALVLGASSTERAAAGLAAGLADPESRVREACARGLSRITENHPELAVARDLVLDAAARESQGGPSRLEQVFTLLSVLLEREPLAIAYRTALRSKEPALRGTAIEYLDNVLPPVLRAAVLEALGDSPRKQAPRRESIQIAEELRRRGDCGPVSFRNHRDDPEP
jgi:AAA family ATP:ADP antiporter